MKLVVDEEGSDELRAAADRAHAVAAVTLAYVEGRSALARMRAGRRLGRGKYEAAVADLEAVWTNVAYVPIGDPLVSRAGELAARHLLRAYDAVHLAGALELPAGETEFACWDGDLRAAAAAEGLSPAPG